MRTLMGVFSDLAEKGYDFWREYGSYRVVEGVLRVSERCGSYSVTLTEPDGTNHVIGTERCGQLPTVKLILPPEPRAHRVTPEEYEKALDTITAYVQQRRKDENT